MPVPKHEHDLALVRALIDGDRATFDLFFQQYFPRLFRFCAKRIDDDNAVEDIVQETLMKALRHLPSYRGEASLFTWLCQICRSAISDWYRKHGRHYDAARSTGESPEGRSELESLAVTHPSSEQEASLKEIVQITLDHLPQRYGDVLEMKYVAGYSVKEIASKLDVTAIAVQSLLSRARDAFRDGFTALQQESRS